MKICVIGTRGFPNIEGGVETHCEKLYDLLSKKHQIIVFRRKPYVDKSIEKTNNITFVDLPSTKIKGFETIFHSFISTINAIIIKPDIIHYHNTGPAIFSFLINKKKIKIVLTYHSANYEHNKWNYISRKIIKLSEYIATRKADQIIVVNERLKNKFSKKTQNICVTIPNGIEKAHLTDKTNILDENELIKNKYILTVGRIVPEKGIDVLINAFNKLKNRNYKLVIVGKIKTKDKYYKYLKSISNNENIVFLDFLKGEDLYQIYQNARLFVLSSRNESSPFVILEAMSYGLDVLLSNIPNLMEFNHLTNNYFISENVEDLKIRLEEILEKNHDTRIDYDLNMYKWSTIAKKTEEVYFKVKQ